MAGNQWAELATEIDNYRQLLERVPAAVYIADGWRRERGTT